MNMSFAMKLSRGSQTPCAKPSSKPMPNVEDFDPSIPSSCSVCRDLQSCQLEREKRASRLKNIPEFRVEFSREGIKLQASRNCTACTILRNAIDYWWEHDHEPGWVNIGFVEEKPAIVRLASSPGGFGFQSSFYLFSGSDKPSPWESIGKLPVASPLKVLTDDRLHLIEGLLQNCTANHRSCRIKKSTKMPKRVLDVGNSDEGFCLALKENVEPSQYTTLSHCWRFSMTDLPDMKLLQCNVEQKKNSICLEQLSQTFRDAVAITRWFRIRYLWIDSLCIIQDDKDDWAEQASQMADIYENAHFTIACEFYSKGSVSDGCFLDRARYIDELIGRDVNGREFSLFMQDHSFYNKDTLWNRGWCVQERVLSRRLLRFQPLDIVFECSVGRHCECQLFGIGGDGCSYNDSASPQVSAGALIRATEQVQCGKSTELSFLSMWKELIEVYGKTNLTQPTDRLPSMSGIVSRMPKEIVGDYVGGLWGKRLLDQLDWATLHSNECTRDLSSYIAPSFSWVSINGHCRLGSSSVSGSGIPRAKILEVKVVPSTLDPYGNLRKCFIRLRTRLAVTRTDIYAGRQPTKYEDWEDPYYFDTAADAAMYKDHSCNVYALELMATSRYTRAMLVTESGRFKGTFERIGSVTFEDLNYFKDVEASEVILT